MTATFQNLTVLTSLIIFKEGHLGPFAWRGPFIHVSCLTLILRYDPIVKKIVANQYCVHHLEMPTSDQSSARWEIRAMPGIRILGRFMSP